jgi:acetyl-CoA carboxylase biotin carboxyl carrier protein
MAKQAKENVSFTDTKRVKELVALMAQNDLTEIELVEDKSKITLKRALPTAMVISGGPPTHLPHAQAPVHHASAVPVAPAASVPDEKLVPILSPLIGTFYAAANPESASYVSVGGSVGPDTVVGIIEAMKVFNEIRAEVSGTVVKILVSNGQNVEFDTPLMMVRPN